MGKKADHQRSVYFKDDSLWADLERLAENEERSVNFIMERAAKKEVEQSKKKGK